MIALLASVRANAQQVGGDSLQHTLLMRSTHQTAVAPWADSLRAKVYETHQKHPTSRGQALYPKTSDANNTVKSVSAPTIFLDSTYTNMITSGMLARQITPPVLTIDFLPLCFQHLLNSFFRNPFVFTLIRIARGCHPSAISALPFPCTLCCAFLLKSRVLSALQPLFQNARVWHPPVSLEDARGSPLLSDSAHSRFPLRLQFFARRRTMSVASLFSPPARGELWTRGDSCLKP
jgi:hypothetical protein